MELRGRRRAFNRNYIVGDISILRLPAAFLGKHGAVQKQPV